MLKSQFFWVAVILSVSCGNAFAQFPWADKLKLTGDLRYRFESIDAESNEVRNRQRFRMRVGLEAQPARDLKVVLQLASGSADPVSTNQTLGGSFSTKNTGINLAYFAWAPSAAPGVVIDGGKMKNPFFKPGKTELIWDGDLTPEGLVVKLKTGSGRVKALAALASFPLVERKTDSDAFLYGLQGGLSITLGDNAGTLLLGASYFNYSNTTGYVPFADANESFGNSLDANGHYLYDYNLVEGFAELSFKAGNQPLTVFFDYVTNNEAVNENRGWLLGLSAGKCKKIGSWALRYNYRDIEKDAVIGAFTDSDFGGGGTDAKGHELGFNCQLARSAKLSVSYFANELGVTGDSYKRLQLDMGLKF